MSLNSLNHLVGIDVDFFTAELLVQVGHVLMEPVFILTHGLVMDILDIGKWLYPGV